MKPAVRNAILILLALLFAVFVWPTAYAYGHGDGVPERRNRFTGVVERNFRGHWTRR